MPFGKKRSSGSAIGIHKKKKRKKQNQTVVPVTKQIKASVENDIKEPPQQLAGVAFVSSIAKTRKSKRKVLYYVSTSEGLGIDELFKVFLELEQLDDKLPRPAVVHERKKLQALANTGTTHTEILDVITIEEDSSMSAEVTTGATTGETVDPGTQTKNQPVAIENPLPLQLPEDTLLQKRN